MLWLTSVVTCPVSLLILQMQETWWYKVSRATWQNYGQVLLLVITVLPIQFLLTRLKLSSAFVCGRQMRVFLCVLKVEDAMDAAVSVETEAMTTVAGQWETLEFDFTNQVDGTPVLSFDADYTKASIFFNFGTTGAEQGEKTYYWDDVQFVPSDLEQVDLPVTFEDPDVFYNLV
jgi:hypothetical protein